VADAFDRKRFKGATRNRDCIVVAGALPRFHAGHRPQRKVPTMIRLTRTLPGNIAAGPCGAADTVERSNADRHMQTHHMGHVPGSWLLQPGVIHETAIGGFTSGDHAGRVS
jgi:hypothetical protein